MPSEIAFTRLIYLEKEAYLDYIGSAPHLLESHNALRLPSISHERLIKSPECQIVSCLHGRQNTVKKDPAFEIDYFPPCRILEIVDSCLSEVECSSACLFRPGLRREMNNRYLNDSIFRKISPSNNRTFINIDTLFGLLTQMASPGSASTQNITPIYSSHGTLLYGSSIKHSMFFEETCKREVIKKLLYQRQQLHAPVAESKRLQFSDILLETIESDYDEYILVKFEFFDTSKVGAPDNPINFNFSPLSVEEVHTLRFASDWYSRVHMYESTLQH